MAQVPASILLVDDDFDFLEIHRHFLEAAGYTVRCACSPDEALQALQEALPDIILTDLMMSALDSGFSFARQVKSNPRTAHIPVVMSTSVSSQLGLNFRPRTAEDLAKMHVDAYLDKPIKLPLLLETIQRLLDAQQAS